MTIRDKILREIKETLGKSSMLKTIGMADTDITAESVSRFKTPLAVLNPSDSTLARGRTEGGGMRCDS